MKFLINYNIFESKVYFKYSNEKEQELYNRVIINDIKDILIQSEDEEKDLYIGIDVSVNTIQIRINTKLTYFKISDEFKYTILRLCRFMSDRKWKSDLNLLLYRNSLYDSNFYSVKSSTFSITHDDKIKFIDLDNKYNYVDSEYPKVCGITLKFS